MTIKNKKGDTIETDVLLTNRAELLQCNFRDISERKKTEAELKQYRKHLERLVEERTKKLQDAQILLFESEKLASIGELGAGVAHEMNSPLTGVLSMLALHKKEKNPETKEYADLTDMEEACKYMSMVIKNLGEFSRKSTGTITDVNINNMINDTLIFTSSAFKLNQIIIKKDFAPDLLTISAEKSKLQQIVVNMITNARDSMPHGGIFTIKTKNLNEGDKSFAEIMFSDTGCGIEQQQISKVFDPFYTTKRPGRGIGLGLSIVYNIIKSYNGTITLESELNKGTTFIIRLPV